MSAAAPAERKRPPPGARREHILQTLAQMLQAPGGERITTAALAAQLGLSEAALYRHFASKAQMFDALIDFIDGTLMALVQQITARGAADEGAPPGDAPAPAEDGRQQAARIVAVLLQFAERNPGMARVMAGDALVLEDARLQQRINQLFERIESALRQALRHAHSEAAPDSPAARAAMQAEAAAATPTVDAHVGASVLMAFAQGRVQRFARTGFRRLPTEQLQACLARML